MIKSDEKTCSGCRACELVCAVQCITMTQNINGFKLPKVDLNKCIDCGECERVCPVNGEIDRCNVKHTIAAYSTDKRVVNSTSGGIFYTLASEWLLNGGIIFGAAYDSKVNLNIREVTNIDELSRLQGSKYFQADTTDSYHLVREHLLNGRKVLYSGTPCQIAGLNKALGAIERYKLLTIEIICHGIPSPKMFADYLHWMEIRKGKEICNFQFRSKAVRKRDFYCLIKYQDGSNEIISGYEDPFYKIFMAGTSYREICYDCPFATMDRIADMTLGDFWNIEDLDIHFGVNERVSVVLINSDVGEKAWSSVRDSVTSVDSTWEQAAKGNRNLYEPTHKPKGYFPYGNIDDAIEFFDNSIKEPVNRKKALFNMLPIMLKRRIKKMFW